MARKDFIKAKANAFAGLAAVLLATGLVFIGCKNDDNPEDVMTKNEYPVVGNLNATVYNGFVLLTWDIDEYGNPTIIRSADGEKNVVISDVSVASGYKIDSDVTNGVTYTYKVSRVLENNVTSDSRTVTAQADVTKPVTYTYDAAKISATKFESTSYAGAEGGKDTVRVDFTDLNPAFNYSVSVFQNASAFTGGNDPTVSDFTPDDGTDLLCDTPYISISNTYGKKTLYFNTSDNLALLANVRVVVTVSISNNVYQIAPNNTTLKQYFTVQPTVN